jgi:proteasome lid subunit RPN8/RPN11
MVMKLEISSAILLGLMRQAIVSTPAPGGGVRLIEMCGILRGRGTRITVADRTENVAEHPEDSFEIDPRALIAAYRNERKANGLSVFGFYHSHPSGRPDPSVRDAQFAAPDGKLWLIVTPFEGKLWRAVPQGRVHGRFDPVAFDLVMGKRIVPDQAGVRLGGRSEEWSVSFDD